MKDILVTMLPIFIVVGFGFLAKLNGLISEKFLNSANQIVFYVALPAIIFQSTCNFSIEFHFDLVVLLVSVSSILIVFIVSSGICMLIGLPVSFKASIVQCSIHGNLGYVGVAVIACYIGHEGLSRAGILIVFLIIFQNFLSIISFQVKSGGKLNGVFYMTFLFKFLRNPVIISALFGVFFSLSGLSIVDPVIKSLDLLAGLALPLALLIIGASISFVQIKKKKVAIFFTSLSKLVLLPIVAIMLFHFYQLKSCEYLPALIFLGSPTATVSYVMAREMNGDVEFTAAVISITTLFSGITLSFWLKFGVL